MTIQTPGTRQHDLPHRFRALLEERLGSRVLEVRLFGSMARGEAHEGSDMDIFVLVDHSDRQVKKDIYAAAWDAGEEVGAPLLISPLVMDRAHFDDLVRRELLIAQDILSEGIPI